MSFLRGVKKGAGIGIGASIAQRVMDQVAAPQRPAQQQPMQQQAAQRPPAQQQGLRQAGGGFFDRLAGSAENMINATTNHINSAAVGTCEYCGTGVGAGDRICNSCNAPVG